MGVPSAEQEVLELLAEASGEPVHAATLAAKLGVSGTAIFKYVGDLRARGFRIEASRDGGYRLMEIPDRLGPEQLEPLLSTRELGRSLCCLETTGSTSQVAYQLAQQGAPHGQVVIAEEQTAGKGRRGRSWVSPPHRNLYLSLVLRPDLPPERAPELTLLAAVAVAEALEAWGCPARIKWPNDLQVGGRKLCGILTELQAEPGRVHFVVVGIGVNLNLPEAELPEELRPIATSLSAVVGRPVPRAQFTAELLARLEAWLDRHEDEGFAAVRSRWMELSSTVGAQVKVTLEGRVLRGQALGIDDAGALLVRTEDGALETVIAGDVETVRPAC